MTKAIQKVTAAQIVCKSMRKTLAVLGVLAASALVHATQTVDPALTAGGATINASTQAVPAGSTFTFFGMYSDDSVAASESGLGLKVKYNPAHLTNLTISEEYTKCRIAAAQVQPLTANTAQAVMGWVDTSVRTAGAVGWPDLADVVGGAVTTACLNPGGINTDTAAGTSVAPGQKLFKVTATMAAGCTTAATCTSMVLFDSEGNFSYATAPAGFTNKSFTINGAAAPTLQLAASNPVVSRKTHTGVGIFDIPIDTALAVTTATVEPRAIGAGHLIVFTFNTSVAATGNGSSGVAAVQSGAGASVGTATAVVNGSTVEVTLTGVADIQGVNVSLTNVAGVGVNVVVPIRFLVGDVNGSGGVSSFDIITARSASGFAADATNFRSDVNTSGGISSFDILTIRANSGNANP